MKLFKLAFKIGCSYRSDWLKVNLSHLHPGYAAILVARSRYYHCHWTVLLGGGCSKPWSISCRNYIYTVLNADGGGRIGYCDSHMWWEVAWYVTCSLAIGSLVKQGLAWDEVPMKIMQKLWYTCLSYVLPCHKPCRFMLHRFILAVWCD